MTTELECNTRVAKCLLEKLTSMTNDETDVIRVLVELSRGLNDE